jgi:transcriptional regulator with PAS, ATPase and Fis domain
VRDDDIKIRLTRVLQNRELQRSYDTAVKELASGNELKDIIGTSKAVLATREKIGDVAEYNIPVLITGETGTGKELVARALHFCSTRRGKPFISINCAAIPETLIESELFGHERGAFTGANAKRNGAFEEATNGTIFLDEIGDLNIQAQASLLRILENGEYRTIGGKVKTTSARVVLATNQDLELLISEGKFRQDLFYRINRLNINIPPLRERKDDIPILSKHFLERFDNEIGKGITDISADAIVALEKYRWPGNIRELKNEIERAYIYSNGSIIEKLELSSEILYSQSINDEEDNIDANTVEDIYKLIDALKQTNGNISKAAKILNVHRNTVHRWVKKFSLNNISDIS